MHKFYIIIRNIYCVLDGKKRPCPRPSATPKLRLGEKDSDEELGDDLLDIHSSPYSSKQGKKVNATYKRKKDSFVELTSPSRRGLQSKTNNHKSRQPKSPSKDFASKRVELIPDPSLSVSSSSTEDDDQTDHDWTQKSSKRQNGGGKGNSKSTSKSSNRHGKSNVKTSPRKMGDTANKTVISDRESSNHSSYEDDNELRLAKGKDAKGNSTSEGEKKTSVMNFIYGRMAKKQKKGSENVKNNERGPKLDKNIENLADSLSKSSARSDGMEENFHTKEDQSSRQNAFINTLDNLGLRYRTKNEHPEIRRPVIVCRIPLTSLKNFSQNFRVIIDPKHSLHNAEASKNLAINAPLVSCSNEQMLPGSDTSDNVLKAGKRSSSERSREKQSRERSRRDSSAGSNQGNNSKHIRKRRRKERITRDLPEISSDSDQCESVESSASGSYGKRRRKDHKLKDVDTQAVLDNTRSRLMSDDQRSIPSPLPHVVPLKQKTNQEEEIHETQRDTSQKSPIQPPNKSLADGQNQQHPGYHDVEYYGFTEHNSNLNNMDATSPTNRSGEHPTPSTSNGIKDTQSHQSIMMPPPNNKMFYSYLEQRRAEEDQIEDVEIDPTEYMIQGKGLKHEADKEPDREKQATKYLQAVLHFILYAHANEQRNEKQGAFTIYQETLNLVK